MVQLLLEVVIRLRRGRNSSPHWMRTPLRKAKLPESVSLTSCSLVMRVARLIDDAGEISEDVPISGSDTGNYDNYYSRELRTSEGDTILSQESSQEKVSHGSKKEGLQQSRVTGRAPLSLELVGRPASPEPLLSVKVAVTAKAFKEIRATTSREEVDVISAIQSFLTITRSLKQKRTKAQPEDALLAETEAISYSNEHGCLRSKEAHEVTSKDGVIGVLRNLLHSEQSGSDQIASPPMYIMEQEREKQSDGTASMLDLAFRRFDSLNKVNRFRAIHDPSQPACGQPWFGLRNALLGRGPSHLHLIPATCSPQPFSQTRDLKSWARAIVIQDSIGKKNIRLSKLADCSTLIVCPYHGVQRHSGLCCVNGLLLLESQRSSDSKRRQDWTILDNDYLSNGNTAVRPSVPGQTKCIWTRLVYWFIPAISWCVVEGANPVSRQLPCLPSHPGLVRNRASGLLNKCYVKDKLGLFQTD
ncbi:unnamed protein product [Protopolystoma xenopodis]|uniref:Uncharacterized protein n=1 Tax=Protopolystoma xenopodis TaxID=117903 RepID=A0A3S5A824_9PLAT|nr:unnamed protein product [Protopolystoma xenopodis]